jgi:hypothetical protein
MSKRAIPRPKPETDPAVAAIKENLEILFGQRGVKISDLPSTASLADVIAKVNEIIQRIQ